MKVRVEIKNSQTVEGDTQQIVSSARGEFDISENSLTLSYAESAEVGGRTTVTLADGRLLAVERNSSDYDTQMFFEKGKKHPFFYRTPYGEILLETDTESIKALVEEKNGYIEFEYDLLSGGVKQSHNRMRISFSEEKDV